MIRDHERPCTMKYLTDALRDGYGKEAMKFVESPDGSLFCRRAGECAMRPDEDGNLQSKTCLNDPDVMAILAQHGMIEFSEQH